MTDPHSPSTEQEATLDEVRAYWNARAARATSDSEAVDQSRRSQFMRFDAFVRHHDLQDRTVLDIGCGVGDLADHLQRRGIRCDYTGIDLSPTMIQRARERFAERSFLVADSLHSLPSGPFDFTVAIGIHNIRVNRGWDILAELMRRQFAISTRTAHLSLLTDRHTGFGTHVQAWKVEDVMSLALSITPYVVVRHDYLPHDFSVTLYRSVLIDAEPPPVTD